MSHAKERMRERISVHMNGFDLRCLALQIQQKHNAEFQCNCPLNRQLWKVRYKGFVLMVVYNKMNGFVCTVYE